MTIIVELTNAVQSIGMGFIGVGFIVGTAVIFGLAWANGLFARYDGMRETQNERIARISRNRRLGR